MIYTLKEADGAVTQIALLRVAMIYAPPMGDFDNFRRVSVYVEGGPHWFSINEDETESLVAAWRMARGRTP